MLGTIQRRANDLGLPEKAVILTFDDGPVPHGQTAALLDVLKAAGVSAGFCLVGRRLRGNEGLVRRIHEEGHLIVNHGQLHRLPDQMSDDELRRDLEAFDQSVRRALDVDEWKSRFFRPPGGRWSRRVERLVHDSGRRLMPITFFAWDMFPFPYRRHLVLAGLLASLRRNRGGVFMLHEAMVPLTGERDPAPDRNARAWVVDAIESFIARAKAEGFRFIPPQALDSGRSPRP